MYRAFFILSLISTVLSVYPMKHGHADDAQPYESRHLGQYAVTTNEQEDIKIKGIGESSFDRTVAVQNCVMYDYSQELVKAVKAENESDVKKLLQANADPNTKDSKGIPCLCSAADLGHKDIVEMLIAHGVDVNAQDSDGWTAIAWAIEKGHKEVVKVLLDKGVDFTIIYWNSLGITGMTLLMLAAGVGNKEIVEMLLNAGADINAQDSIGRTALIRAIDRKNKEVVKLLLDKGANPAINYYRGLGILMGSTPLMIAADLGHKEIVEMLLNAGADINAQDTEGRTALVRTMRDGHKEVAALLLKRKAEVIAEMKSVTSMRNKHEINLILDLYLSKEVQPYIIDPQGYACRAKELFLEKQKYSRDCKTLNRSLGHMKCTYQTVLMWASICGHTEAIEEVLKADLPLWCLNAQGKDGRTALMYALIYGHNDIAQLLIQAYEAERRQVYEALEQELNQEKKEQFKQELEKVKRAINIKDAQGNSAFSYVLEKGADTLALRFLQAGAQPSLKEIKKIADENKKDLLLELIVKGFISPCCDQ